MCLEVALYELEKRVLHSRIPDGFLYRRMKATIFRRLAITIKRMVALGRAPDLARAIVKIHGRRFIMQNFFKQR